MPPLPDTIIWHKVITNNMKTPIMDELIKQCRYYKGEADCPFNYGDNLAWFWDMERVYVRCKGVFSGEDEYFNMFVDTSLFPGIPPTLLKIMFTS